MKCQKNAQAVSLPYLVMVRLGVFLYLELLNTILFSRFCCVLDVYNQILTDWNSNRLESDCKLFEPIEFDRLM